MKLLKGLDEETYRALPGLSKTELSWMKKSPLHFFNRNDPRILEETDAMRMGTLLHLAVLEPAKFKNAYVVEPEEIPIGGAMVEVNKRIKKHREYLAEWREEMGAGGKIIVTPKQYDSLIGMLTQAASHPDVIDLLSRGEAEIGAQWDYRGFKCKGRADYLIEAHPGYGRVVVEIKKTQDASPEGFSRQILNKLYDMGAAWYREGFKADEVIFIACEEKFPYAIGVYKADPAMLDRGMRLADRFMDKIVSCEKENYWHGYTKGVELIQLPAWVAGQDDEEAGTR